jgi:S1-C subfamily serine protease
MEFNDEETGTEGNPMTRCIAAVSLLIATMWAQNAVSTNKSRHLDIPAISREANGSIISIVMSDTGGHPIAQGSGFFINKDGQVVTNYHVIKSGTSALIKLPDGAFFVVDGVLASDKTRDVAIIKAHGSGFHALTLGDSDRLQVGEEVVAIGNPLSLESTVSNGIVSAIRTVEDEGGKFVQITAPISPGSSGGPLFNMAGEVVGITTSHLLGGQNLNFAIPINDVKPMLAAKLSKANAFPDEPEDTKTSSESKPDLDATVNFMRNMVEPDGTSISYVGGSSTSCDIAFSDKQERHAAFVSGKRVEYGNEEPTFSIIREVDRKVSLEALSPTPTITDGLSAEWFERTQGKHGLALVDELQHPDLTLVMFKDADGSVKNLWMHFFSSKDRAERFITATKHAITLCGGKDLFAPTATQ